MERKYSEKLKEYIESIEQLGANSRWSLDFENWGALDMKLRSIEYWARRGRKLIEKIKEEEENEKKD